MCHLEIAVFLGFLATDVNGATIAFILIV